MSKEEEMDQIMSRVDGLKKRHKLEDRDVSTGIPNEGRWYVHRMRLTSGRIRYFISNLPREETFELSVRWIFTKYGVPVKALATPVTLRFLNVIEDYMTKELAAVYLVVACPSYVRSDVSVQKMTESIDSNEFESIRETHELNAAMRLLDVVERERAARKNAQEESSMWKRNFELDRGAAARKMLDIFLEGDEELATDMMEKKEGWNLANIKKWIGDNIVMLIIGLGVGLVLLTKILRLW